MKSPNKSEIVTSDNYQVTSRIRKKIVHIIKASPVKYSRLEGARGQHKTDRNVSRSLRQIDLVHRF